MIALMCRYRRRFDRDEEGLSLIEVMISLFILSVAIAAVASVAATSLKSNRLSRDRQEATNLVSSAIETVRAVTDYAKVGYATGRTPQDSDPFVNGGKFAYDGTSAEAFVEAPAGVLGRPGDPTPYVTTVGQFTIRRFLTWYDDPNIVGTNDTKRLTVIATWSDPAFGPGEVRESTLLAEARRGLPAPAFDVSPDLSTETAATVGPSARVAVFNLALSNLGERDSYSLRACPIPPQPAAAACTQTSNVELVSPQGDHLLVKIGPANWKVSAALAGAPMADTTGDLYPDSAAPVDRGGKVAFDVTVEVPATVDNTAVRIELLMVSAFDSNVDDAFELCVNVGVPPSPCTPTVGPPPPGLTRFYGHWSGQGGLNALGKRLFEMDTVAPARITPINLDRPSDDAASHVGMRLDEGNPNWNIKWDYQNQNAVPQSLSPAFKPVLKVWTQSEACFTGGSCSARLFLNVTLQTVDTSNKPNPKYTTIATGTLDYVDTLSGWEERDITLEYISGFSPATNADHRIAGSSGNKGGGYLRLIVSCSTASDDECHLDFDNTSRPTNLTVKFL